MMAHQATSEKYHNENEKWAKYRHESSYHHIGNNPLNKQQITPTTPLPKAVSKPQSLRCKTQNNHTDWSSGRPLRKGTYEEVNEPILSVLFRTDQNSVSPVTTGNAGLPSKSPVKASSPIAIEKTRWFNWTTPPTGRLKLSYVNFEEDDDVRRTQHNPLMSGKYNVDYWAGRDVQSVPDATEKHDSIRPLWDINTVRSALLQESANPGYLSQMKRTMAIMKAIDSINQRLDVMNELICSNTRSNQTVEELVQQVRSLKDQLAKKDPLLSRLSLKRESSSNTRETLVRLRKKSNRIRKLKQYRSKQSVRKQGSWGKDDKQVLYPLLTSLSSDQVVGEENLTEPWKSKPSLETKISGYSLRKGAVHSRSIPLRNDVTSVCQSDSNEELNEISKEVKIMFKNSVPLVSLQKKEWTQMSCCSSTDVDELSLNQPSWASNNGTSTGSICSETSRDSDENSDSTPRTYWQLQVRKQDSEEKSDSTATDTQLKNKPAAGKPKMSSNSTKSIMSSKSSSKLHSILSRDIATRSSYYQNFFQMRKHMKNRHPRQRKRRQVSFAPSVVNKAEKSLAKQGRSIDTTIANLDRIKSSLFSEETTYINTPEKLNSRSKRHVSSSLAPNESTVRTSAISKLSRSRVKCEQKTLSSKGKDNVNYRGSFL